MNSYIQNSFVYMSFINVKYPLKIIRSNSVGCFEVIELLISSNTFMRVKEYCYKFGSVGKSELYF